MNALSKFSKKIDFIDFFIKRNQGKYTLSLYYERKDFKFYISWFIYAIYDNQQNLEEMMINVFTKNCNLDITFLPLILSNHFVTLVRNEIENYKNYYGVDNIY